jgi:hypothetical protein
MLWVHVAADFNAIVSKQRKIPSGSSGISEKAHKIQAPTPRAIFAQVFILRVLAREDRISSLFEYRGVSRLMLFIFVTRTIAVPKSGGSLL